jgi:hypothetical protein
MHASVPRAVFVGALLLAPAAARAQPAPADLPPLPPPEAPTAPPPATMPALPPPPPPAEVVATPPPANYVYAPPPRGPSALSLEESTHAPAYSLWLGGSVGVLAYGGGLYQNEIGPAGANSGIETTGNFVTPGAALQADVGARLGRRYIPYLAFELGLLGAGHRFDGTSTSAHTEFIGFGFRYLAGDVDFVSFASDISMGFRTFEVSNGSGTWKTSGFEIFRLGFGADIRLTTRLTLSPMVTVTGGTMTDTSGNITFGPNQPDGKTHPDFTGNSGIPSANQYSYLAIVVGCGVHTDLLGK